MYRYIECIWPGSTVAKSMNTTSSKERGSLHAGVFVASQVNSIELRFGDMLGEDSYAKRDEMAGSTLL